MIYDISPPLSAETPIWPGDVPFSQTVQLDIDHGDAVRLSSLRCTAHLGAHADAPSHYGKDGCTIDAQPLELYIGACRVVRVSVESGDAVDVDQLPAGDIGQDRVLFAVGAPLAPGLIDHLADLGVQLIGVDTLSVDRSDDEDLPTHQRCLAREVAILEGLLLDDVPEGVYELIALPLRLVGFDASPVRAVLRSLS